MDLDSLLTLLVSFIGTNGGIAIALVNGAAFTARAFGWANPDRLVMAALLFVGAILLTLGIAALEGPLTLAIAARAVAAGVVSVWSWAKVALPSLTTWRRVQRGRKKRGKGKGAVRG